MRVSFYAAAAAAWSSALAVNIDMSDISDQNFYQSDEPMMAAQTDSEFLNGILKVFGKKDDTKPDTNCQPADPNTLKKEIDKKVKKRLKKKKRAETRAKKKALSKYKYKIRTEKRKHNMLRENVMAPPPPPMIIQAPPPPPPKL